MLNSEEILEILDIYHTWVIKNNHYDSYIKYGVFEAWFVELTKHIIKSKEAHSDFDLFEYNQSVLFREAKLRFENENSENPTEQTCAMQ